MLQEIEYYGWEIIGLRSGSGSDEQASSPVSPAMAISEWHFEYSPPKSSIRVQ